MRHRGVTGRAGGARKMGGTKAAQVSFTGAR